jgi:hypothetical protein
MAFLLSLSGTAFSQLTRLWGYAQQGAAAVTVNGISAVISQGTSNVTLASYPNATVTIYAAGGAILPGRWVFSDSSGTIKGNPFTADANAYWFCYLVAGTYDVRFSGTGITVPFTNGGITVGASGGGGSMVYPDAGIPVSVGVAGPWGASLVPTLNTVLWGNGTVWAATADPTISAANMTNFPTLNQSTSGNADTATYATTAGSAAEAGTVTGLSITPGQTLTVTTTGTLGTAAYKDLSYFDAAGSVTPTSLGLVIGTNVQAYSANLATWAGLASGNASTVTTVSAANLDNVFTSISAGFLRKTGAATYAELADGTTAGWLYNNGSGGFSFTTPTYTQVGAQAYNANLTAIDQALTTASSPNFNTVTAALTGHASLDLPLAGGTMTGGLNVVGADGAMVTRFDGASNQLGIIPYLNSTYGAYLVSRNAADTYKPMSFDASAFYFGTGNVGIGTPGPTHKLEVIGDAYPLYNKTTTSGTYIGGFWDNQVNQTYIGTEATTPAGVYTGSLADASFVGAGAAYPLQFFTDAAARMTILSGGNVGFRTLTPRSTADIKGDLTIENSTDSSYVAFTVASGTSSKTYTWPSVDGLNTYVLSTDGAGHLFFTAPGGGGGTGINSFNGSVITAQTLVGDGGLISVSNSGTGNYIHTVSFNSSAVFNLGASPGTTGKLTLTGVTSGVVGLTVADTAGTWTFKLPASGGTAAYPLITDGSGNSSWSLLTVPGGGTGLATITTNGILYGNGTSAIGMTAAGTTGQHLTNSSGVPAWTTATYPTTTTAYRILYSSGTSVVGEIANNTTVPHNVFLAQTEVVGVASPPAYFDLLGTANTWTAAQTITTLNLTGTSNQLSLGASGTAGGLVLWDSGTHHTTIGVATMTVDSTLTLPASGILLTTTGNGASLTNTSLTATYIPVAGTSGTLANSGLTWGSNKLTNTGDFVTNGPWIDVRNWGAKCDGTTDDAAAIQAAINAAEGTTKGAWNASTNSPTLADGTGTWGDVYTVSVSGTQFGRSFTINQFARYNGSTWQPVLAVYPGAVQLPTGACGIGSTVVIHTGITFKGMGKSAPYFPYDTSNATGSYLIWVGSSSGTMLKVESQATIIYEGGNHTNPPTYVGGFHLSGFTLEGSNPVQPSYPAARGLEVHGAEQYEIYDVSIQDYSSVGIYMTGTDTGSVPTSTGTRQGQLKRLAVGSHTGSTQALVEYTNGNFIEHNNTVFSDIYFWFDGTGPGVVIGGDSQSFYDINFYYGTASPSCFNPPYSCYSIDIGATNYWGANGGHQFNRLLAGRASNDTNMPGSPTVTGGVYVHSSSLANSCYGYHQGDFERDPVITGGSEFSYTTTSGADTFLKIYGASYPRYTWTPMMLISNSGFTSTYKSDSPGTNGLLIDMSGLTFADSNLLRVKYSNQNLFSVSASGRVVVGAATGGDTGAGTINAAGNIYVNAVARAAAGANTDITSLALTSLTISNPLAVAYGGTGTSNGNITGTGDLTFTAGIGSGSQGNIFLVPTDSNHGVFIQNGAPLVMRNAGNTGYVAFHSVVTSGQNIAFNWPTTTGTDTYALVTDAGSPANLSWAPNVSLEYVQSLEARIATLEAQISQLTGVRK